MVFHSSETFHVLSSSSELRNAIKGEREGTGNRLWQRFLESYLKKTSRATNTNASGICFLFYTILK